MDYITEFLFNLFCNRVLFTSEEDYLKYCSNSAVTVINSFQTEIIATSTKAVNLKFNCMAEINASSEF